MKRFVCAVLLIAVAAGLTGCVITVNDGCKSDKDSKESRDAKQFDTALKEIDAAKTLSSDETKLRVLSAIASRPGLSHEARVNLIETAKMLDSDEAKEQLLMIIANKQMPPPPPAPQAPANPQ